MIDHQVSDLIAIFDGLFGKAFNTRLIKGESEPLYQPAGDEASFHQVIFAHGFYASAMHEISHWCVAGTERRKLLDYGYWYVPDGRDAAQQQAFEQVEAKPQALEWILCKAAGFKFNISVDNLNGVEVDREPFAKAVCVEVGNWLQRGLPDRAAQLVAGLQQFYQTPALAIEQFQLSDLISLSEK